MCNVNGRFFSVEKILFVVATIWLLYLHLLIYMATVNDIKKPLLTKGPTEMGFK